MLSERSDRTIEFITTLPTMTAIAFLAVFLRFFCKMKYAKELRLDDYLMVAAWLLTLGSLCLLLVSVFVFGYTLHRVNFTPGAAAVIAVAQALSSISGAVAKTSIAVLLWRVTPVLWQRTLLKSTTTITILSTVIIAIVVSIKVHDNNMEAECEANSTAWRFGIFYAVWGVLSDFMLSVLPWVMVWNLQMKKAEKYGLAVALSMGCVTSILGIMKLSYINCTSVLNADLSYTSIDLVIYHFIEPPVIITAASIPALRSFLHHQVTIRRSSRASELLDLANPPPHHLHPTARRSFLPRVPGQTHQTNHHPLVDSESMVSLSAMFRGLPPSPEDLPPMPIRSMPVARVGVAGAGADGRNVTTVTTITGGNTAIRSASAAELPKDGEIVRTVRVVVVNSEGEDMSSLGDTIIGSSTRTEVRSWNSCPGRVRDLEMGGQR
ncbi:hypothetical protein QBC41DRAFT_382558 [Cercophora samala]|uniref:Rhodopsin domain-containing protein n=1 Tax=Cercophora samala TaxID=330535 RepID=A0AA39ZJ94_9PEZI|nr:hypothetical protein QBC41DRAFT_382558 [Cercophora samala]